ncbi:hypothetical protein EVAR_91465_1 [Eumeta japonica]|uniref:Uncharacterized protein n=1 Tax=Eumeta variegata TaxID=151549 RepID=A0A4C1X0X3_EUMVA|nr:hypothetical protein EVAR_91465_1 [Eumeta japonica]
MNRNVLSAGGEADRPEFAYHLQKLVICCFLQILAASPEQPCARRTRDVNGRRYFLFVAERGNSITQPIKMCRAGRRPPPARARGGRAAPDQTRR